MKKLSDHEIKSASLMHIDLQGILEDPCFGDMEQEPMYKNGRLTNRHWYCTECGEEYSEIEVIRKEQEREDVPY